MTAARAAMLRFRPAGVDPAEQEHSMRAVGRVVGLGVQAFVIASLFASTANAGCVDPRAIGIGGRVVPARYLVGSGVMASTALDDDEDGASIVGMWQFTFSSQGNNVAPFFIPDEAPLDAGYAQWHSDGTEIMNSSRDPATSSFCLGTWKAEGHRTYKLNHFAISWDNTGHLCTPAAGATSCMVGPANIREEVTVDRRGETYAGTVTIDQYDNANHLLFHLAGKVAANRINPD
jgi:hypothetical protein